MSDMSVINSSTSDAIDQLVIDSGRMHKVINGTAAESVTVEDGSLIPSLRKALLQNLYYQTPILPWVNGSTTQVFNQLYAFTEVSSGAVSWWYAPSATATNPVSMKASPATDANWRVVLDSATLTGLYATINSPTFTGVPLAPTVDVADNSDSIATTKFVNALIAKILQDVTMVDAEVANLTVTGDAEIFNLTAPTANITTKLTVQDLEILGDVTGIQTSVDGEDIAPKSITTTEKLEVGGDTTLHGTFQLADKTIMLGDGTLVDLTNIGTATSIEVSQNLNLEVGNKNFIWDSTTPNSPIPGTSGKGLSISKTADEVTQVTWPDGEPSAWVRNLSAGAWSTWENAIASNTDALAGTATNVAVSPAGVAAFISQYGVSTDVVQTVIDLNSVTVGQNFNYDAGTTNAPTSSVGGRGALLPATQGNATQLVIENANNKMFIRYYTLGTWGDWTEFKGEQGLPGDPGQQGVPGTAGLSAYEIYVNDLPVGETPMTEEEWLASLQGSSFTVNATGATAERAQYDDEAKGFAFLDTTTGLLYIKNSATSGDWSDGIPFKGDPGTPGVNGSTWFSGATVPASSLGVNGDFYLKTDTDDVYKKSAGIWTKQGNIKGADGSGSGTLPIATASVLGGVKIGAGVTVAADGTISTPIFATTDEAKAATSTTVMMSPTRVREFMENHGLTATFTTQATNLNLVVTGDFFNYAVTTLNRPGTGGYGRGICIPSGTGYVTQFAIENDSNLMFIRYQTDGVWGDWTQAGGSGGGSVTFATTAEAQAATSTTVAMSPARTREQFEPLGFGSISLPVTANLNTLTKGQFFNWDNTSTNTPVASSYGRGIMIAGGGSYNTQIGIINDTGAMYIRYATSGTWGDWIAVGAGGSSAVMKPSGTGHAAGLAPDPGATAGTTKFLREDATWAVPAGGGGGGGSTTFTSALLADMNLVGGGSATSSFVSSGVTIDPTKIYKFSAVLLLRTGAGNTVDLKLDGVGPDMFGMSIQYANASGVAAMARSEQATSNVTMTLPADVSIILLDGTMHSSYYGPKGPQVVLSTGSSGWGALLKGSCWTLTPVGTYPST